MVSLRSDHYINCQNVDIIWRRLQYVFIKNHESKIFIILNYFLVNILIMTGYY